MPELTADLAPDALIYELLSTDPELMGLVTDVVEHPAPDGSKWPLVTFAPFGNGSDVTTLSGDRVVSNVPYLVRVIGRELSTAQVAAMYARVDALLDRAKGINDDGTVYGIVRTSTFRLTEVDAGVTFRHVGGIYKVTYGA